MAGETPFYVEGKVVDISTALKVALVKVDNGNVYQLLPRTPGIDFDKLRKGQLVELEVTSRLTRVLSAIILEE